MPSLAIDVRDLTVGYGAKAVLVDVSLSVPVGGSVCLIGPNGAGKSTLLRTVLGLLKPQSGSVRVLDAAPRDVRSQIAYVPQHDSLDAEFPISALEVVALGRLNHGGLLRRITKSDRALAADALAAVGLAQRANDQFGALSGGQRQRILIARAIAQQAQVLLLDEPFNGVDAGSQHQIVDVLGNLRAQGVSLLMSTHDLSLAHLACDDACLLNKHNVASGRVNDVLTPDNLARLYGSALVGLAASSTFVVGE